MFFLLLYGSTKGFDHRKTVQIWPPRFYHKSLFMITKTKSIKSIIHGL